MGQRRLPQFPSTGGIDAGSPFVLGGALFVEQTSPPVAFTQRLIALTDTNQSLIAVGPNGSTHSFVMGENAADSIGTGVVSGGTRSVLLGYNVKQAPSSIADLNSDQVLVGNNIDLSAHANTGNNAGLVAIGGNLTLTATPSANSFGGSVVIGQFAKLICINIGGGDASNAVSIGQSATVTGQAGIAVGPLSSANNDSIAIGDQSGATVAQSIAFGYRAGGSGTACISIGANNKHGTDHCTSIGDNGTAVNSVGCNVFGAGASANARTSSQAFGRGASVGTDNMVLFGARAFPVLYLQWGAGENDSTGGRTYRFSTTYVFGGAGANLQGNTLQIQAGGGTGNWANAQNNGIDLMAGLVQAAGSTAQPPTSVIAIRHSDLNVAFWGGLGATFGGGARMLFVGNAVTLPGTAPTGGGLMYATGGELHWVSSAGVDYAITPTGGGGSFLPLAGGTMTGSILMGTDDSYNIGAAAKAVNTVFAYIVSAGPNDLNLKAGGVINLIPGALGSPVLTITDAGAVRAVIPGTDANTDLGVAGALRFRHLFLDGANALTLTTQTTTVGGSVGTLTNAPSVGNPTGYLQVSINGATGKIPYWT